MKIGVFDSGLGGLSILKSIRQKLPEYDYVFLGDTLHVPYGSRSPETISSLTQQCVHSLFDQDCALVIVACNTACAHALRDIQHNHLPEGKRVLGVVVPTLEAAHALNLSSIGLLATSGTIQSGIYREELEKIHPDISIIDQAAPLLVPLMEHDGWDFIEPALKKYLSHFQATRTEGVILGCTHYGQLENTVRAMMPQGTHILSQNKIVPASLADYLSRHDWLETQLSRNGTAELYVTELTDHFADNAKRFFSPDASFRRLRVKSSA